MTTKIRMRMDFLRSANQTITEIDHLLELLEHHEIQHDIMPMADVRFQVLAGYLEDIANRAVEIDDKPLLDLLEGLGIVKDDPAEDAA